MEQIEVRVSEILEHLQNNGQYRAAIEAIVAQRTQGRGKVEVTIIPDVAPVGELSDQDLDQVAGGTSKVVRFRPGKGIR